MENGNREKTVKRRVAITGMSVLAPIGASPDEYWKNLLDGICGINAITEFDASQYRTQIAGRLVPGFQVPLVERYGEFEVRKLERVTQIGLYGALKALEDASIDTASVECREMGVVIGSGVGGMMFYEEQIRQWIDQGARQVRPNAISRVTPNTISSNIAIKLDCHGPDITISTACSSSSHAIGIAYMMIKDGMADRILTGGAEAPIVPVLFAAFDNMKVMSHRNVDPLNACRPFDINRDGFILAEGAAMLILEEMGLARARGAKIYAEVYGYGQSSGGYHMVIPAPGGLGESQAMAKAMAVAGVDPAEVDYVNAHGTGTVANDASETLAIKRAFHSAAYKPDISSTKSQTGHLVGASGSLGCVTSVLAIRHQIAPGNANLVHKDPLCDLNFVGPEPRRRRIRYALANSFGFGNNNASILLREPDA